MTAWIPANFEEACQRNAGRRKLHMRKREARADRIMRMLASTHSDSRTELSKARYGMLTRASQAMAVSKATASRDLALVRQIHGQFLRMFGRNFDRKRDRVVWAWNWAHYGFITPESKAEGYRKPVGRFPFDTRKQQTEESYCGFNKSSWDFTNVVAQMNTWELIRAYGRMLGMRARSRNRPKNFLRTF